nr:MAG TPA: hypothetical protein [Caudoviricetes sp.]
MHYNYTTLLVRCQHQKYGFLYFFLYFRYKRQ